MPPTDSPPAGTPSRFIPAPRLNQVFDKNERMEAEYEAEKASGFADRIRKILFEIGIDPRDQKTNRSIIPDAITRLKCWNAFPSTGFGLIGPAGCGKSCALVAQIRAALVRELSAAGPSRYDDGDHLQRLAPVTEFKWVGWPSFAGRMKNLAGRREWTADGGSTEGLVRWLQTDQDHHRVLILDDLGMERMKDGSGYATEQLELLVDAAYGYEARVIWTSNRPVSDGERSGARILGLANTSVYGPRLVSRLTGLAPDVILPEDLPDLRIRRIG